MDRLDAEDDELPLAEGDAAEFSRDNRHKLKQCDGVLLYWGGMALNDAVKKMRGKPNTNITLTISRKGETQPVVVTLTRAVATDPASS